MRPTTDTPVFGTPAFGTPAAPRAEDPLPRAARLAKAASLLPLRAFLGVTFCFAGLQKLANPNFFDKNSPISIFSQIAGAERTSPVHALLGHLLAVSTPLGLLIALGEVAIGLGVLAGLLTRMAALGGMALSFGLFLTVSFNANPYYTGADIVFFFAFTPLLLAGPGELLALDPLLRRRAGEIAHQQELRAALRAGRRPSPGPRPRPEGDYEVARRQLLARAAGALGAVGLAAIGLDAAVGRLMGGAKSPTPTATLGGSTASGPGAPAATTSPTVGAGNGNAGTGAPATTGPATTGPATTGPATTGPASTNAAPAVPPGKALGPAGDVPVGGAATFTDPATGDPAVVIQLSAGAFLAYDTVCPHAGCTVGYSEANKLLICPCHGSVFDPSNGDVVQGPAPTGLRRIQVAKGPNGDLYAV